MNTDVYTINTNNKDKNIKMLIIQVAAIAAIVIILWASDSIAQYALRFDKVLQYTLQPFSY
jgi:hypothetical protein